MMRCGEVIFWRQKYGFIRENGTDERFFVHINEVSFDAGALHKGQQVSSEIGFTKQGRPQAINVVPL